MRLREASKYLKIGVATVRRKIKAGLIKATKYPREKGVGGHEYWEIEESALDNYLNNCRKD